MPTVRMPERVLATTRDLHNRIRFGPDAPQYAERVWIDPRACRSHLEMPGFFRRSSGRVETGRWPVEQETPIDAVPTLRAAVGRWRDGLSWADTGELDRMAQLVAAGNTSDGIHDASQIEYRCQELDQIFATVRSEGRLRTRDELEIAAFREHDGIGVHVADDGSLVKGGGGLHRFAIALVLGIPVVPAQLLVVHVAALERLDGLRRHP